MFVNSHTLSKKATYALGDSDTIQLKGIPSTLGNLYRYLLGLRITISTSFTQSASTAVLLKEVLLNILSSVQVSYAGRTLFTSARGSLDQFIENLVDAIQGNKNDSSLYTAADFANDQSAHPFRHCCYLPFAHEFYRTGRLDDEALAGMVPVGALGDGASVQFTILNSGFGAWALTSAGSITVLVEADILNTSKKYLCVYPESEIQDSTQNPLQTSKKANAAVAGLWIYDPAGAFAPPTGEVSVKVGSILMFDQLTGQQLYDRSNAIRSGLGLYPLNTTYDDVVVALLNPLRARVPREMPVGDRPRDGVSMEVVNAAVQNSSGTSRYMWRRLINPDASLEAVFLAAVGERSGVERTRLFLNDKPISTYPEDEIIGSMCEIR
jgi:hypothetical protein